MYDISILSSIPSSVSELPPLEPLPIRLQPLFSVGVHDIDDFVRKEQISTLPKEEPVDREPEYGWVACTTDDVLGQKKDLYDVLVTMPPLHSKQVKEKVWPKIHDAQGTELKASQRDLRRFRTLRQGLRTSSLKSPAVSSPEIGLPHSGDNESEQAPLLPITNTQETFDDASSTSDEKLVEPLSWSALAYSSFMWWASAGEQRADLDQEVELDSALFRDFQQYSTSPNANRPNSSRRRSSSSPANMISGMMMTDGSTAVPEMAIIAYFYSLTTMILVTLSDVIDAGDADGEEAVRLVDEGRREESDPDKVVVIGSEQMSRMGLDAWSEGDRKFVEELVGFYWGRKTEVRGGRVECCGIRIF